LGNVLVTVSDRKTPNNTTIGAIVTYYKPVILTANDYYPFGMLMPGRNFNAASVKDFRFGFNGKMNDNDVKNVEGGQQDYGMRIYDPRVGKFLSVDPITAKYPELTPFQFASNRPIDGIDEDGLEFSSSTSANFGNNNSHISRDNTAATPHSASATQYANGIEAARQNYLYLSQPILANDLYGNGVIASRRDYNDIVIRQQVQFNQSYADNIRGGLGGSIGSMIGGFKGSQIGASFDGITTAVASYPVENSSVLSKPRQPVIRKVTTTTENITTNNLGKQAKAANSKNTQVLSIGNNAGKNSSEGVSNYQLLRQGVASVSSMVATGSFNQSTLKSLIPGNMANSFYPTQRIAEGYKYDLNFSGLNIQIKWHSPDSGAPAGSNSANMWTAQIKIGNRYLGTDGGLHTNNRTNETHIPVNMHN
jgi:RHS repeat-associated protein